MTRRRLLVAIGAVFAASLFALSLDPGVRAGDTVVNGSLPDRLTATELWSLSGQMSEANGYFRSDNLLSNEILFQHVIPDLMRTAKTGRVYMGVGPEQNFTYIAALKPALAFIVDIRRGNLQLHLMYKALFELSSDRADFVGRLFSKKRPEGLTTTSTVQDIFAAYAKVDTSETLYKDNLKAIQDHLIRKRGIILSDEDLKGMEYVYYQFYWYGPVLQYWSAGGRGGRAAPTYVDLMIADDGAGHARSYLATEENFAFLKNLEEKNLLIPVVGNFSGQKALRAVGKYLREHGGLVSAFYLSNVEQYLARDGTWWQFCGNVATLPLDETSMFIRSVRNGNFAPGVGLDSELGNITNEVKNCGPGAAGVFSHIGSLLSGQPAGRRR